MLLPTAGIFYSETVLNITNAITNRSLIKFLNKYLTILATISWSEDLFFANKVKQVDKTVKVFYAIL
jgi:hypothetical protein